jgi:hypothetical protein
MVQVERRHVVGFSLEALIASITAYGVAVTKLVDLVRNTFGKKPDGSEKNVPKYVWQLCALAFGVMSALLFGINVFESDFAGRSWASGVAGQVLTGLAIGAAGSGWHEALDALSGVAKAGKASTKTSDG